MNDHRWGTTWKPQNRFHSHNSQAGCSHFNPIMSSRFCRDMTSKGEDALLKLSNPVQIVNSLRYFYYNLIDRQEFKHRKFCLWVYWERLTYNIQNRNCDCILYLIYNIEYNILKINMYVLSLHIVQLFLKVQPVHQFFLWLQLCLCFQQTCSVSHASQMPHQQDKKWYFKRINSCCELKL